MVLETVALPPNPLDPRRTIDYPRHTERTRGYVVSALPNFVDTLENINTLLKLKLITAIIFRER